MSNFIDFCIYLLLKLKGGDIMIAAMLLASRVIRGKTKWEKVPPSLRPQVLDILEEEGLESLATEK